MATRLPRKPNLPVPRIKVGGQVTRLWSVAAQTVNAVVHIGNILAMNGPVLARLAFRGTLWA